MSRDFKQSEILNFSACHHHNSAVGFNLCSFSVNYRGQEEAYLATVFDDGRVAVFSPSNIGHRCRADDFEEALRECLRDYGMGIYGWDDDD